MATLADIRLQVQRDIRDINAAVFTSDELNDLINQALDTLSDLQPREATESVTVVASTYTYNPSTDFSRIFRIDVHNSSDSYQRMLARGSGGRTTGWDFFAGLIYLDPNVSPTANDILHVYGYARYSTLTSDETVSDAPTSVINAGRVFIQMEVFNRLSHDRASFQQWQASPGNTDVSENEMEQLYRGALSRWSMEKQRVRRMRRAE